MAKKLNAFALFTTEPKKAKIEALDGAEITYRELTMLENDSFSKRLVKGYGDDGVTPEIDFEEATLIKYEKASAMLIEPAMTVEELQELASSALGAINEIIALGESKDMLDKEGNSED